MVGEHVDGQKMNERQQLNEMQLFCFHGILFLISVQFHPSNVSFSGIYFGYTKSKPIKVIDFD